MKIEQWDIAQPVPYARNARVISDAAVSKVAASLKLYGWRQPIVVDSQGVIIAGHTRLQAAQKLGMKLVPVHVGDEMSVADVKAYRLADNRTGEETDWDRELLAIEFSEFDLELDEIAELTGFDVDEIDHLMSPVNCDIDELPEIDGEINEPEIQTISVKLHRSQVETVKDAMEKFSGRDYDGGTKNGTALYFACVKALDDN